MRLDQAGDDRIGNGPAFLLDHDLGDPTADLRMLPWGNSQAELTAAERSATQPLPVFGILPAERQCI